MKPAPPVIRILSAICCPSESRINDYNPQYLQMPPINRALPGCSEISAIGVRTRAASGPLGSGFRSAVPALHALLGQHLGGLDPSREGVAQVLAGVGLGRPATEDWLRLGPGKATPGVGPVVVLLCTLVAPGLVVVEPGVGARH